MTRTRSTALTGADREELRRVEPGHPLWDEAGVTGGGTTTPGAKDKDAHTPAAGPATVAWTEFDALLVCGMILVVLVAFLPTLDNGWVAWDDDMNFLHNPEFRSSGWPGVKWAWTTYLLGVYQPLAWMLFKWQYVVGGLDPIVYHGTSLALHLVNTVALYLLSRALIANGTRGNLAGWTASAKVATTAAVTLFAVHPLRVEVVAWVSCQPYLLCVFFSISAVLAYLQACEVRGLHRRLWLAGSYLAFAAALMSKAPAIILPVILVILDIYPLRRLNARPDGWLSSGARRVWQEKLPMFLLAFLVGAIALRARLEETELSPWIVLSLGERLPFALHAVSFYLVKTFVPYGLSAIYVPRTHASAESLTIIVGVTCASLGLRRRWPALAAGWAIYLAALVPSLVLILLGLPILADRCTYLPSIAGIPLLACGLSRFSERGRMWRSAAVGAAALGCLAVLIPITWRQCRAWRSSETLWTQVVAQGGALSVQAHRNLGDALLQSGHVARSLPSYKQAESLAREYLGRHPHEPWAESILGCTLKQLADAQAALGQGPEALHTYRDAIEHQSAALRALPKQRQYRLFLANHYRALGRLQGSLTENKAAHHSFERCAELIGGLIRDYPAEQTFRDLLRQATEELQKNKPGPGDRREERTSKDGLTR